jgi:hypothetical protein
MFYELCDEVNELDWAVALQQLIELLQDALKQTNKKIKMLIQSQLEQWISGLPSYQGFFANFALRKLSYIKMEFSSPKDLAR